MSKVLIDETTLTGIADAIRSREGSTEKIPPLEMPMRIEAISGGCEIKWTDFALALEIDSLNSLGAKTVELYLPKLGSLASFCKVRNSELANTTVEELTIRTDTQVSSIVSFLECGYNFYDRALKKLNLHVDTSKATIASLAFAHQRTLEEITGTPLDLSSISGTGSGGMFNYCQALKEVRFKGVVKVDLQLKESKKLSKTSIESIISCLSPDASGKTLTLSKVAVDAAFETSEGADDGSSSAEWLALVAAHSNWTISLV